MMVFCVGRIVNNGRSERDEHQNGVAHHMQHFLKPKIYRSAAVGITRPEYLFI
jgi:hypothetical protein